MRALVTIILLSGVILYANALTARKIDENATTINDTNKTAATAAARAFKAEKRTNLLDGNQQRTIANAVKNCAARREASLTTAEHAAALAANSALVAQSSTGALSRAFSRRSHIEATYSDAMYTSANYPDDACRITLMQVR